MVREFKIDFIYMCGGWCWMLVGWFEDRSWDGLFLFRVVFYFLGGWIRFFYLVVLGSF